MTSAAADSPLVIKGWSIFAHQQFLDSFESLAAHVERLRAKDPKGYTAKNPTKRLAAIVKLAFEIIPADPTRPEYRQGATLGNEYTRWPVRRPKSLEDRYKDRFSSDRYCVDGALWAHPDSNTRGSTSARSAPAAWRGRSPNVRLTWERASHRSAGSTKDIR
jgi:hypothetical protein